VIIKVKNYEAFSFGYWGWGHKAKKMVEYIDYVEAEKGNTPPMFVDIRIRRVGRTRDFIANRFENIVGTSRYKHIPELGNQAIIDKTPDKIIIKDPTKAKDLLDIITSRADNQKVIFFCACEFLRQCHRYDVSKLLVKEAKKSGEKIRISEWFSIPIENKKTEICLDNKTFNKINKEDGFIQQGYSLSDIYNMKSSELLLIKNQETGELIKRYPAKVDTLDNRWKLYVIKEKAEISILET